MFELDRWLSCYRWLLDAIGYFAACVLPVLFFSLHVLIKQKRVALLLYCLYQKHRSHDTAKIKKNIFIKYWVNIYIFPSAGTSPNSSLSFMCAYSLILVYFILLQKCFQGNKHFVCIVNDVIVQRTPGVRVGHGIHVYDVKARLTHGWHGVSAEQKNSLNKETNL